jgi:hypothetical protein
MNKRLVAFVIALALLTFGVFALVAVVLPQQGLRPVGPILSGDQAILLGGLPGQAPSLLVPRNRLAFPAFGLRPFGLDREGLAGVWWHLGTLVSLLIASTLVLFLFPRRIGVLARVLSNGHGQRLLALVVGLLGYLGLGLLAFLIFINVVGWPLMLILTLVVYLGTCVGLVAVGLALGQALCRAFRVAEGRPVFHLGVGVLLLFLGSLIPYLGWIVAGISGLLGFGAVLWTRLGDVSGWSLDMLQE